MLSWARSWKAEKWPFIWRVGRQLFVPALLATCYALFDHFSSAKASPFSIATFFKVLFPALFFVMWFVGLYEREQKKAADKTSFNSLSTDIKSLAELVGGLRTSAHAAAPEPTHLGISFSGSLMREAFEVFQAGHKLAALLQAGVAFEQAAREFARKKGMPEADTSPLLRILQRIDFLLPQDWLKEFHMLRQIRNRLAHASEHEIDRVDNPEGILKTYALAIEALSESLA